MDVKYVLSVSGILVFLCSYLHSASCHYQGSEIGTFGHEDSTQLVAIGTIYAVDKSRIFIKSFTFDGNQFGRDIHFFAGRSDATGVIIPDEMGTTESLGMYFQHDVLLVLPSGQEIANFSWIAIWDVMHEVHYGYVNISCQFKPPDRRELGDFSFTKLGCKFHVDNVVIENIKQVTFIGVVYDHWKSGFSIYAGNGSPESTEWKIELLNKDEDSKLSFKPGVNLTMTLPDDLTVFEIDFIGVWVQPEVGKNFNVITITDQDRENLPPYIPNTTETKRCEVLLGDMYQVSWQLDKPNNQITLELSGRVASNEYMAFGISGSETRTQMVGSDVTVVWIDPSTNEPEAEDYHMSANIQCVVNSGFGACPDTFSSEGSNDVHLVGAVIRHGVTTITVERPLKSDDPLDKPIPTDEQVYTFWSLGTINNVGLVAHHHHSAAGDLEINFETSGRSFCTEFLALDKDEKDNTSTKNHSPMLYDTSSFTGRHITKRNVGSPDPLALMVADACCFFMCQNGGVGFFTADQQSRCVCPSPFTGDSCQQGRDLCDPNPCQNSGSCILLQTFLCICAPGFTGTTCDLIAGGPFTVVCPADVLVLTLAGTSQTAAATWREPDAPGYQFIQSSHAPGDEFPVGETSVDYLFTTSQGFQTCTFCVTVQEVTLTQPTVNDCVNVEAFTLQDRMAVQFMEPTAADGCGSVLLFSATARSGDFFPVGQTAVTFSFSDSCGNIAVCNFVVTVNNVVDVTPPSITNCPTNIVQVTTSMSSFVVVMWDELIVEDVSQPIQQIEGPDGFTAVFLLGTTTTVNYAYQDSVGNIGRCAFDVTVRLVDVTPPSITNCPTNIVQVTTSMSSFVVVMWDELIVEDVSQPIQQIEGPDGFTAVFLLGTTTTVNYAYQDSVGNIGRCAFDVTVRFTLDASPPDCGNILPELTECISPDANSVIIALPQPSCSDDSGTGRILSSSLSSNEFSLGNTTVNVTCIDDAGNRAHCLTRVSVIQVEDPCYFFPCANDGFCINIGSEFVCQCQPGFTGIQCEEVETPCSPNPCLNAGSCNLTDVNEFRCMCPPGFTGQVCDQVVGATPTITCPGDVYVVTDGTLVDAVVRWIEPGPVAGFVLLTQTHRPGDIFPVGQTTVMYLFLDTTAITLVSCEFIVMHEAVDLEPPTVSNIADVTVTVTEVGAAVEFEEPTAVDAFSTAFLVAATHRSGDVLRVGSTIVTHTFSDFCGNTVDAVFVVTVKIPTPCPADILQTTGLVLTPVTWIESNDTTFLVLNRSHQSGDSFPTGQTTVTIEYFETSSGERLPCTFTITLIVTLDTTPPDCGNILPELTECVNPDANSVIIALPQPSCSDDSGTGRILFRSPSSNEFSLGNTTVNFTCTDDSGNRAHCLTRVSVIQANVPCNSFPCMNGGFCISMGTEFLCTCQPGFIGNRCEEVQTPCSPNPCLNAGSCVITGVNEFSCDCPSGFIGQICNQMVGVMQTITCPDDIYLLTNGGGAEAVVSWIEPAGSVLFQSHRPGDLFPVGETSVTYVILDSATRIITCEFRVLHQTVDVEPPTVSNVRDVTINVTAVGAAVEFEEPTAEDALSVAYLVSASHRSGDVLPIGSTVVNNTFSDRCGNTVVVTFVVTVELLDTVPPVISDCPSQQTITLEPGQTFAQVVWFQPSATDNSGTATLQTQTHSPGDSFVIGQTTVMYIFLDPAGNTANCEFIVLVQTVDTTPPVCTNLPIEILECVELGDSGLVVDNLPEPICVDISGTGEVSARTHTSGSFFIVGDTNVVYTCSDASGNTENCVLIVRIVQKDTVPPKISGCPNDMSAVIELGTPTAVVGRTEPTATDLSGTVIMTSRSNGPGESFSIGLTTVAYIFSDASGNAASCSFVVTVITEGITPPMIVNCPSLIERQVELGVPGLIITWTEPSATDISGTAMLVDRTHAPNDFFPVGITKVIYTFTDSSQNGAVCSFIISITIVDTTPPECVNLPAFVSESTELGNPGRRVTWIEPTCQDISNVASVTARSNLPGSFFLVGDTVVTYTCTDGSGNSDTCSFPVQVFTIDTLRPQILECPDIDAPSVIATIEPGITSAIVQFDEPTATDASNSINVESSCNSGDRYPVGTTTCTFTFTDSSGNSGQCVFTITVLTEGTTRPEVFQCPDEVRTIVELGITSTVVFYDEPFATDNSNAQNLLQTQTCQRGDSYPVGETSCLYLFVDPDGNSNSCTFLIIVTTIDTVPPVISDCPSQQTITIEPGQTSAQVVWFQPSATDNSGTATLQTQTHSPGESFVIGQTTVMYIFLDPAGNTANCEFIVLVQTVDTTPPVCTNLPIEISECVELGDFGLVVDNLPEPICVDISGTGEVSARTHTSGSFFIVGDTNVVYTCSDASGNTENCVLIVRIVQMDTTPPVCTNLPIEISECVELGDFGLVVDNLPEPICVDISGTGEVSARTHTSGSFFIVGDTNVVYTCSDASGNTENCVLIVRIVPKDTVPPTISGCPNDLSAVIELGTPTAVVRWTEPTATDLSRTVIMASRSKGPGESFSIGLTTVVYIFSDASGNAASCSFVVTVITGSTTPPMIVNCPSLIERQVELGVPGLIITWTEPSATDTFGTAVLVDRTHAPNDFFPVGITQVIYTFTESSQNGAVCSFTISITTVDTTPPECVNLPAFVSESTELGNPGRPVTWIEPNCQDISNVASVTARSNLPGSFFLVGDVVVTYTCTDGSGNSDTCSFPVQVFSIDTLRPQILECPDIDAPSVMATIELGITSAIVQFDEPTATDASNSINVESSCNSGDRYPVGTTTCTFTFTDSSGNSDQCVFTITVLTVEEVPPVIACVGLDVAETIPLNGFGTTVQFREPTATDNSGTASVQSRTHSPGQFFQSGTTQVTYVFIDPSGNTAECSFNIIITEAVNTPPSPPTCPNIEPVTSLQGDFGQFVTWDIGSCLDSEDGSISPVCDQPSGDLFPVGQTTNHCTCTDLDGATSECEFTISVNADQNICAGDRNNLCENGGTCISFGSFVFFCLCPNGFTGNLCTQVQNACSTNPCQNGGTCSLSDSSGFTCRCPIGFTGTTCSRANPCTPNPCLNQGLCIALETINFFCFCQGTFTGLRCEQGQNACSTNPCQNGGTCSLSDSSGFTCRCPIGFTGITCSQVDNIPPVVSCINDITQEIPLNSFGAVVEFTEPTATDNSGTASVLSATRRPGQFFQTGTTTVTYIFADPSGNTADCVFDIIVVEVDDQPPQVICPPDVRVSVELGQSRGTATWTDPVATDDSGVVVLVTQSHFSNSMFPVGETQVMYTYRDGSGNTAECTFNVIVSTGSVTSCCPSPIFWEVPLNSGGIVVEWGVVCNLQQFNIRQISSSHRSGQTFNVGTTEVTLTFADADNFQMSCSFPITITQVDDEPPQIVCIDFTAVAPINSGGIAVDFPEPTATDNSGIASVVSSTVTPGVFFRTGDTTVTYIFSDPSGNSAPCSFVVTVEEIDSQRPSLTCSGNIVLTVLDGVTERSVSWSEPVVMDNSGSVSLASQSHQSGDSFPVGTTTVLYTYQDPSGNVATCSYDIIIVTDIPCQINTCLNGGSCIALDLDTTMCVCPRCFEGDICQFAIDPCEGNLCGSGSTCIPVPYSCTLYTCECPRCFMGQFCTEVGNVCDANDCVNGAVCQPDPVDCTLYVCQCPPCFSGASCEQRADGCVPNPCVNNGICSNLNIMECSAYRCDCVGCFSGYNCELPIPNPCDNFPCLNGGTCTRNIEVCASYTCRCQTGFDGDNCEQQVIALANPCNSFPCRNGASCMSAPGETTYVCLCRSGYSGINCDMMSVPGADLCSSNTCQNSGNCFVSFDSGSPAGFYQPQYVCLCAAGFTGFNCFINTALVAPDMDPCSQSTGSGCLNGGKCVNTYNSFSRDVDYVCTCARPYTGKNCERAYVDPCNSAPCQFGGTCTSFQEYFICTCDVGFMGTFCHIPTLDITAPVVRNCPENIVLNSRFNEPVVGVWIAPTASDDSGFVDVLFVSHMSGFLFPPGYTAVSYIYVDPSNNQAACSFVVSVLGSVTVPAISIVGCPGDIYLRTLTGSAVALWTSPTASSSSGQTLNTMQSQFSGSSFNLGTTVVIYTYSDNLGNQASCIFTVNVAFETGISIRNCPNEVRVTTTDPNGRAVATWTEPEGTVANPPVMRVSTHQPGTPFPVGSTTVTYTFTDNSGNMETCTFPVIVTVSTAAIRIMNCPNDITQPAGFGGAGTEFTWTPPTGFDRLNNAIIPQVNRNPPVFLSPNQELMITYTFISGTDISTCTFTLRVGGVIGDNLPPSVISQSDTIVLILQSGQTSVTANWVEPVVTDNSGTVTLLRQSHFSGASRFSVGRTAVEYLYSDPAGNQLTVTFDVIVNDINADPCTPNPCLNQGLCIALEIINFFCFCQGTFTGLRCEQGQNACSTNPCQNGGTCSLSDSSGFTCRCPIGFTGTTCSQGTGPLPTTPLRDTIPPVFLSCPNDMIFNTLPPAAAGLSIPISWTEPTYDDEGGTIRANQTHSPRDSFRVGDITNVVYTIVDLAGNAATCEFLISLQTTGTGRRKKDVDITFTKQACPCLNGGVCLNVEDGRTSFCHCPEEYSGMLCEVDQTDGNGVEFNRQLPFVAVVGVLVIIIGILAIALCQVSKNLFKQNQMVKEDEVAIIN
ncbi:uncharacterized protein [Apostichopus japonicus]|uniref:uncharacterized protein isoform X6 n=1 Tax=Stichopus japonicus TaxID=307972 RepID=UPI003AB456AF